MFLLTHFALMVQAVVFLLACVICTMLLERKTRGVARYFLIYFAASLLFNAVFFLDQVSYTYTYRWFYILEYPAVLLAAIAWGELCYRVAGQNGTRAIKAYRAVIAVSCCVWTISFLLTVHSSTHYMSDTFNRLTFLPMAIGCWQLVFLPYVLWTRPRTHDSPTFPEQRKAIFGLWCVAVILLVSTAVTVNVRSGNYAQELVYLLFFVNNLAVILIVTLVLFRFVERRFHVSSKIALATSQFSIVVFAVFVCWHYATWERADTLQPGERRLRYTPTETGYSVSASDQTLFVRDDAKQVPIPADSTPSTIDLSWPFPFYGFDYDRIHVYRDGQIAFGRTVGYSEPPRNSLWSCIDNAPAIAALCSPGTSRNAVADIAEDSVRVSWAAPDGDLVASLVLTRDGRIETQFVTEFAQAPLAKRQFVGLTDGISTNAQPMKDAWTDAPPRTDLTLRPRVAIHDALLTPATGITLLIILIFVFLRTYLRRLSHDDIYRPLDTRGQSSPPRAAAIDRHPPLLRREDALKNRFLQAVADQLENPDFRVDDLADALSVSVRKLHRMSLDLVGMPPGKFLREQRLEHARQLLGDRIDNVSGCAYRSGFKDVSSFSKAFQKQFGMTPSSVLETAEPKAKSSGD